MVQLLKSSVRLACLSAYTYFPLSSKAESRLLCPFSLSPLQSPWLKAYQQGRDCAIAGRELNISSIVAGVG